MGHGYVERMEMAKVRVSESEQERESRSYFVDHFNKYVTEEHPKETASFSFLPFINASDNETNQMLLFRDGSMDNAMSGHDRPGSCELSTNLAPSPPRILREEAGCGGGASGGGSTAVGSASDGGWAKTTDSRIGDESKSNTQAAPSPSPMGEQGDSNHHALLRDAPPRSQTPNKVSIIPLIFLIFYEVSGGPFGIEDSVQASGPLLAILGFLVFPLIWSIPEALITAEMGTMFPEDGGYVIWVSSALGPYWGFQQGWMKWLSGVIDNALYPVLFLDYLKSGVPALGGGAPRTLAVLGLTAVLTYMNYRGLTIVGWLAVCLGVFSMLPFLVMGLIAIPRLRPARWLAVDLRSVDWNLYLNTLFWNLNYWDSISTLAGEVENPTRTLPKALFYAVILVVVGYLYPLLAGTGAIPLERELWTDGYFSDIAKILGGVWLMVWVQAASALSNMGMFVAEMSSDSYQLLGMAEHGMLPEFFRKRSRHGTPLVGILFSAFGVVILSWMSFQEIIAAENFLYCFGMLLEFVAFIRLRMKHPRAARPYKVPLGTIGSVIMLIPPTILIVVVLALSSVKVMVVSLAAMAVGLVLQPCLKHVEKKRWLRFSMSSNLPEFGAAQNDTADFDFGRVG